MREWFQGLPFFTRTYVSVCLLFTALVSLNLLSAYHLFYTLEAALARLHLWRPLTALLFIDKPHPAFPLTLFALYAALHHLETQARSPQQYAEFLWTVGSVAAGCVAVGTVVEVYFLSDMLTAALVWVAGRKGGWEAVRVGSYSVDSGWLPYAYLGLMVLLGHQLLSQLAGLLLGLAVVLLQEPSHSSSKTYLSAPRFLVVWCEGLWGA